MMNFYQLRSLIERYDSIVIFRHIRPDGDAAGSQLGLRSFLRDNFTEKKVLAAGMEVYDRYPFVDDVSDKMIKESLAIVVDTSNRERIDDQRFLLAKKIVKIDHHPIVDQYGDLNYVKVEAAAACQFITEIITDEAFKDTFISKQTAEYLYSGLLTDTLGLRVASVTAETIKTAYILSTKGIDVYELNRRMFDVHRDIFDFCSYMRNKVIHDNGLAYAIIDNSDLEHCHISGSVARNYVSELGGVIEHKIWCLFTQAPDGSFDGSLRSQKPYPVNQIAAAHNGGGHANASGVKKLSLADIKAMLEELKKVISKTDSLS